MTKESAKLKPHFMMLFIQMFNPVEIYIDKRFS